MINFVAVMQKLFFKYFLNGLSLCILFSISSCNTGIESTRAIKMSKSERKELKPLPEELFVAELSSLPVGKWNKGKSFMVADEKAYLLMNLESGTNNGEIPASILKFEGTENSVSVGGEKITKILFSNADTNAVYSFNTGKKEDTAYTSFTGLDIPGLIDLDLVEKADSLLKGKKLWIKTQVWYDESSNVYKGKKFIPVSILKVTPGNLFFPLKIEFSSDNGADTHFLYMNVKDPKGLGAESRTFPSLFSLTDPKQKYPSITEEVWENIQNGTVAPGMTKEECRLSLGNPTDVDAGHDWNNTIDLWKYRDGTFLQFQDGVLVRFRN